MSELLLTRYGELEIPEADDLIARFLKAYGEWAFLECEFLRHNVPQGSRLFDTGAYIGTFSLGARFWSPLRVVAIDGNPNVIAALTSNLDRNLAVPHVVVQAVIGNSIGQRVTGTYVQKANLGSMTFSGSPANPADMGGEAVEAAVVSLAALRGQYGDYDVLKLDIEGSERDALDSDAQWINEKKPIIWLECNEDARVFKTLDFLTIAGYDVYYFAFPSFNPENYNHNQSMIFPVAFEAGLLAVSPAIPVVFPKQLEDFGCLLARVRSDEDLRKHLWLTPRWGMADWPGMSRTQLLGLCSRYARKHDYGAFLKAEPNDGSSNTG